MKGLLIICSVAVLTSASACSSSRTQAPRIPPSGESFMAAFNDRDAASVADLYTEDAILLPPDAVRLDGRQAIGRFWQGAIDAGISNLVLETVEVEITGDTSYEVGVLSLDVPGENGDLNTVSGKYIVIWKYGKDGEWRLHRDIWNVDPATSEQ